MTNHHMLAYDVSVVVVVAAAAAALIDFDYDYVWDDDSVVASVDIVLVALVVMVDYGSPTLNDPGRDCRRNYN